MTALASRDKTRIFEILAVVATALGKFIFMDYLKWKLPFIVVAIIFWIGYVVFRKNKSPQTIRHWGFRKDNFTNAVKLILPFGLVSVAAFAGIGLYQGTINLTWHIIPILLLYPIWGTIQQFLLIALVVGNLQDFEQYRLPKIATILLAALLFGAIHYPFSWLIIGTFLLALFYGFVYLKQRNIYALGIFHGWLGGLFFYTVVNRDPFVEVFGRLFH